jgi:hypothetical protein
MIIWCYFLNNPFFIYNEMSRESVDFKVVFMYILRLGTTEYNNGFLLKKPSIALWILG